MFTPRLKAIDCLAGDGALILGRDPRSRVELADPTGQVRAMLCLLAEGRRTPGELRVAMAEDWPEVDQREVDEAIEALAELGWIEDARATTPLTDYERERYFSNLAFFDAFTSPGVGREEIQQRLIDSRVVILGTGGLGSSVIQNLLGLGVRRMTLVDRDTVALRNFARQFVYVEDEVGRSKVERVAAWVRAFDSRAEVTAVDATVSGPDDVREVLDGADLVVSAIDDPEDVDLWVNEACVGAGIPMIRGGLAFTQGLYWSVAPGRSACRQCLETHRAVLAQDIDLRVVTWDRVLRAEPVNRGIGPVAQLLGSLVAMEALRYLTGIVAPVSAGTYQLVDFSGDCSISSDAWPADPGCRVCATAPRRGVRGGPPATQPAAAGAR
jgi:molybdopterin-synthase adenylyltransferase